MRAVVPVSLQTEVLSRQVRLGIVKFLGDIWPGRNQGIGSNVCKYMAFFQRKVSVLAVRGGVGLDGRSLKLQQTHSEHFPSILHRNHRISTAIQKLYDRALVVHPQLRMTRYLMSDQESPTEHVRQFIARRTFRLLSTSASTSDDRGSLLLAPRR